MPFHTAGSLIDLLRDRAATQPDDPAFTFLDDGEAAGASLTWRQLEKRSRALGAAISTRVDPGGRVLILMPPSLDFVPAFMGVLYAGATAVPAYPPSGGRADRSVERLRAMIADAGISLVVGPDARVAMDAVESLPWLDPSTVPEGLADEWRIPHLAAPPLALLQYTSGSTAAPRGVMVSHENLLHNLAQTHRDGRYSAESVSVSWLPVNHDMGLINGVLQPVFSGCRAYLMAPAAFLQRPLRWLQAISRFGATHSGGPNFAYDLCVRRVSESDAASLDLSGWRVAYNGSEPVRRATLEAFQGRFGICGFHWDAFSPAYGLAESTLLVTSIPAGTPPQFRGDLVASGILDPNGPRVVVVDPQTRSLLPDGTAGEIWVASDSVTLGYWNRREHSAETFCAKTSDGQGPFLRTGDLGLVERGRLFVTGRLKDVLIVRGVKHHPPDLELTAERAHSAIRPGCCAAVGLQVEGEERVALVAELDARELERANAADLGQAVIALRVAVAAAHHVAVHRVALVPPGTLPKTTSGKLQRFLCREALVNGTLGAVAMWNDDSLDRVAS